MISLLSLPAGLVHARDFAIVGHFSEADTADTELSDDAMDSSAAAAAGVVLGLGVLLGSSTLDD